MDDAKLGDYKDLVERITITNLDQLLALGGNSLAFYSGTFNPPHFGHQAVMEAAVLGPADFVIVSVSSHDPAKQEELVPRELRIVMTALTADESDLRDRIRLASPEFLDGIQNEPFIELCTRLLRARIKPWVVMGADALKSTYKSFMRPVSHMIVSRPGCSVDNKIIADEVVYVENIPDSVRRLREQRSDLRAIVFDRNLGAFHQALSVPPLCEWPDYGSKTFLLMSEKIEGHDYHVIETESSAFRIGEREWKLSKDRMGFQFNEDCTWTVIPAQK